jgi:hypothetical protein
MKLSINGNLLSIKLNPLEIILAHRSSLNIPLDHITMVSIEKPKTNWGQVRAPGTHIPFLIKSGTFYGMNRKEFWQTTAGFPYLVIELINWDYNRIVLTVSQNKVWADKINALIRPGVSRP